jgi:hypothetical protein
MGSQIPWSVEAKLLCEIKDLANAIKNKNYILVYPDFASFPNPGILGTLYVDESTGDIYVWNGSSYVLLSSGITSLNGLIAAAQVFSTGTSGSDFNISSLGTTHTFNFPTASATKRGLLSSGDWTIFNNKQNALTFGSVSTSTSGVTVGNGASSTVGPNVTVNIATATSLQNGLLSSTDWSTFNSKQDAIFLTTTGNSGASTLVGNTLNIPNYTLSGLGGVPTSRTLTINGTSQDLSVNRSWSVGTVTSITFTSPLTGGTVTGSGTVGIPQASGASNGYLSASDWSVFNGKQSAITLTTTGSSGASTFIGNTLNVPTYTLSGLGGVPTSRTLTINGTALDLSADRSWSVGTVTSVAALTIGTTGTDVSSSVANGTTTPVITLNIPTASATNRGALSSADWTTFNGKQNAITLTTTGSSGAATLIGSTLNIPQYTGGLGGSGTTNYVPKFTASTTVGDSQIVDDGVNIGINVATPIPYTAGAKVVNIVSSNANTEIRLTNSTTGNSATSGLLISEYGDNAFFWNGSNGFIAMATSGVNRLHIEDGGDVGIGTQNPSEKLEVSGNILLSGNIKTGSPSGGTAKTWKLGNVSVTSPTSPNRTIEVEIDGTTYYIHAKTTNN